MTTTSPQTSDQLTLLNTPADPPIFLRIARALGKFLIKYPLGAIGLFVIVIFVLMAAVPALFTPLASQSSDHVIGVHIAARFMTPNSTTWFGTNGLGRDVYARLIYGARTAVLIGFGAVLLGKGLSTFLGILSAFMGGWTDAILQRFVEVFQSIPTILFLIIAVVSFEPRLPAIGPLSSSMLVIVLCVSIDTGFQSSRTVRGVALALREETYVEAAISLGASNSRIMAQHILPNLFQYVIVSASLFVGAAVLLESVVSFLGYGVQPPSPSWGRELNDAREELARYPHLAVFPGLFIFATVWSFNMFGDALRDKLDPRLRGSN